MQSKKLQKGIVAVLALSTGLVLSAGLGGSQAQAQTAPASGGTMELPKSVTKIVSVDAHNYLLVESVDTDGKRKYSIIQPHHVYSGGLARIFGGTIIPTGVLVSPAFTNGLGPLGQVNRGGFGAINSNQPMQGLTPFAGTAPNPGAFIGSPVAGP